MAMNLHALVVSRKKIKAHHQINPSSRPVKTTVNHYKCSYGSVHVLYIHCMNIKSMALWQYCREKYIWGEKQPRVQDLTL
jgi:hypothetical protein